MEIGVVTLFECHYDYLKAGGDGSRKGLKPFGRGFSTSDPSAYENTRTYVFTNPYFQKEPFLKNQIRATIPWLIPVLLIVWAEIFRIDVQSWKHPGLLEAPFVLWLAANFADLIDGYCVAWLPAYIIIALVISKRRKSQS